MLLALPFLVFATAAPASDTGDSPGPAAQGNLADADLGASNADEASDLARDDADHDAASGEQAHAQQLADLEHGDADEPVSARCPQLSGPERRQVRHARWRERHQVDVTYSADSWEVAMRGEFPSEIRSGLFEDAEIVEVQPVVDDEGGSLEWVAVVELDGELAELCDAERVSLRLDDGFGRSAHVIALHPEGVLLRARDRGLVFLSAEDSEQPPDIDLVYSSSFELVNAPKASKSKSKRNKRKKKKKKRRGRRRR